MNIFNKKPILVEFYQNWQYGELSDAPKYITINGEGEVTEIHDRIVDTMGDGG